MFIMIIVMVSVRSVILKIVYTERALSVQNESIDIMNTIVLASRIANCKERTRCYI